MAKPVCFMIMPFKVKRTDNSALPTEIDFDALWEKAFAPAIEAWGYRPVRADQDLGALIITEMLTRLVFSDLVLADMTLPNGNVYYEVGLRHAAVKSGCVLIGAEKAKPLFDVDQMRQIRYPLPEGKITDETAEGIRQALMDGVPKLMMGVSPLYQALPGYPDKIPADHGIAFTEILDGLSRFRAEIAGVYRIPKAQRLPKALALRDAYANRQAMIPYIALELLNLLRDVGDWKGLLEYIDTLPPAVRNLAIVLEQECLAKAKLGNNFEAIGQIEEIIRVLGDSPERRGLLGGRYKELHKEALKDGKGEDAARFLDLAIESYGLGMRLDLNDFYPSSNLPRLLRLRGEEGDKERAQEIESIAMEACRRAMERNPAQEWVRETLLGLAFDSGDARKAAELVNRIRREGAVGWKLETTILDLERSLASTEYGADFKQVAAKLISELKGIARIPLV